MIKYSADAGDFLDLSAVIHEAEFDIRYFSSFNFVGRRIRGYDEPVALLTENAACALKAVSADLKQKGLHIKVFDAYRPQSAVDHFAEWAADTDDTCMKEYFYPDIDKSVLFSQGYIAAHSSHSRGSTVDLTLVDDITGKELDMGGTFDLFSEISHSDFRGIAPEQYSARMLLRSVLTAHGFMPLAEEWWHFTLIDEPFPDTYFTFPVSRKSLK